ncbi:PLP-dependent aminotransferase family protein [Dysgonomonas sp. Marseille-P4677]|uniref:MocR-like pyridoxine biosynthesis transcription factor PdxR n=1 Tax=Dysgonomonas sp. Marseille-P4677 TaxID=2364790 RepID=UPI001913F5FF|nr:PLP-dependent aminotransferase family protein [Dysgonomonas sp. Marseille-P4677]MBK5722105.1 PLP-dependent aminotransferase family protein [Dysgonomonas sp. Marseille-P4677]
MNIKLLQSKLDRSGSKAIYIQIADLIIESIKKGVLKAGETMPSTRHMATELSVNRNTVVLAFDILINEGWLISEERKKTYVSDKIQISQAVQKKKYTTQPSEIFRNDLIFFDDGLPDATYTPMKELARAYRRIFSRKAHWQIMNIASEFGDEKFRETISGMLNQNRGMQTSVADVCITRGSQMALFLTAHCLLEKGDIVLVENPGYRPAWCTFEHVGAKLIPVNVDEDGINIDLIEAIAKKKRVKAIYLTPHHQYPTTVTLSLARRLQLIELSNKYGFTIIEDDYDNEYHFIQRPVMPISSFEGIRNYVYIGTLSKLIAPAIRVGYIASNPKFILQIGKLRKMVDLQGDAIMEQSILDLIISGDIRRHQKRMLAHYQAKRDFFADLLDRYMEGKIIYNKPDGGLAFWLKPIRNIDLFQLKEKVNSELISFYTPDRFSYDKTIPGLRIGYASLSEANLENGIRILSKYL